MDVSEVSNFSSYVSGYQDILVSGGTGTMQQTINGLVPGKNYYYRVRAIGPNVNSANSTTATTNTTISAPSPSEESNRTNLTFQANWISEPGAVSYLLDVSTDGSFSAYVPGYANKPVTGTSETVSGLSPGTNYYYRLEAVGSAVTSSHSIAEAAYTTISAPTASPEVNQTTTSFIANWGGVNGASSYQLDVSKSSNFTSYESGYQNLSVTGTGQTVGNLTSGKIYYFRVRAVGPGFTSGNSNTIMTNTIFPAPTVNVASAKTNDSFQANWTTSPLVACRLDVSEVSNFSSYVSGYQDILVSGGTGTMQQTINGLV
ncbi:MAG: hypothetical protein GY820_27060, partial [Gammaproteobacteria bacterium]|nr:hypothetical protein [Gammaproteobacteria bacterium]